MQTHICQLHKSCENYWVYRWIVLCFVALIRASSVFGVWYIYIYKLEANMGLLWWVIRKPWKCYQPSAMLHTTRWRVKHHHHHLCGLFVNVSMGIDGWRNIRLDKFRNVDLGTLLWKVRHTKLSTITLVW